MAIPNQCVMEGRASQDLFRSITNEKRHSMMRFLKVCSKIHTLSISIIIKGGMGLQCFRNPFKSQGHFAVVGWSCEGRKLHSGGTAFHTERLQSIFGENAFQLGHERKSSLVPVCSGGQEITRIMVAEMLFLFWLREKSRYSKMKWNMSIYNSWSAYNHRMQ